MRTVDAIARIMKAEGIEYLSCFPTTPLIEAAAAAGIRPIICRQERVGVGIADGFSRVKNGRPPGVFAMQYGPGAENAFPGVATAYSDSTPLLLLPLGHTRQQDRVLPLFSSLRTYESVTKSVEQMNTEERVVDVMRRAFASLRNGRGGPVMVEIPADLTNATVDSSIVDNYRPVPTVLSQADPEDVEKAAQALLMPRHQGGEGGVRPLAGGRHQHCVRTSGRHGHFRRRKIALAKKASASTPRIMAMK